MRWLLAVVSTIALTVTSASVAFAVTFDNPQGNFNWKVYDYNASGQALSSRQPFLVSNGPDGGIAFNFLYTPDTALFITGHPSYRGDLIGDLSSKTSVSAKVGVTVTPSTVFTYYGEGTPSNACGTPANARFFFQRHSHGPFSEFDYWWSNSVVNNDDHALLETLKAGDQTIEANFVWTEWSDFYGHRDEAAFTAALQDVGAMGLSFGGGCFFENGVGIDPGTGSGYFRLMDFSTTPSTADDPLASVVPELVLAPFVVPTLISIP